MRSRLALVTAVAASTLLVAAPAQARHTCNFDDGDVDRICEAHPENDKLFQKIFCLISPSC